MAGVCIVREEGWKGERKVHHTLSWGLEAWCKLRDEELVWLFKDGVVVLMKRDSIILVSEKEFMFANILKSLMEKGWSRLREYSLIEENGGWIIGLPALGDTPLCSA